MKDPRYPFALEPGTEIGGYRIDRVLGAGGFGITYRGYNEITHKQVAIKEFYIREISSRDGATVIVDQDVESGTYEYALRKFQEEAQSVVTRFQHPYIIRGENFVRAHNTCYLIMDYIEGSNLDDWLNARKQPPTEAEIRPFFDKLFDAVDYVHRHNMMHRDLTPRNIMVRLNGDPVLIDFGAAGLGIDLGRSSKIVAQLRYAPPEQSDETSTGVHGRYTDVFSLAGVLFRMVTGKTPMAPTSRLTRMGHYRDDRVADPQAPVATLMGDRDGYSSTFLAGIDRGLLLDERLRPQSIAEFRRALGWIDADAALADEPAPADAVTTILPPPVVATAVPSALSPPPRPAAEAETAALGSAGLASEDAEPTRALSTPPPASPPTLSPPPAAASDAPMAPIATVAGRRSPVPRRLAAILSLLLVGGLAAAFRTDLAGWIGRLSEPAAIAPYRFQALFDGKQVQLSGYVQSDQTRTAIRATLAARLPAAALEDQLAIGRGAPAFLAGVAEAFLGHLPDMAAGTLDVDGGKVTIAATAASPAAYRSLKADLSGFAGADVALVLEPATVASTAAYGFRLETGGPETAATATLSGLLPSEAAQRAIAKALQDAWPGLRIEDHTDLARGAPFDIAAVVAYLEPRLRDLDHANLVLVDGGLLLSGAPRDPALIGPASAPIDPAEVPGHVPVTLAIVPLVVSPYVFKVTSAEGSLTLSGYVPDAVTRQEAMAGHAPDLKMIDRLQIASGAPDNDIEAIRFAVAEAGRLETGSVTITDQSIDIAGTIRRVADVTELKTAFSRRRPRGFSIGTARYGLREDVPAQDCDRLALPPDHQDKPAGVVGVTLDGIDAARAIAACRQAAEVFPNVRRFVTALGAALQKDGKFADARAAYRLAIEADDATAMALYAIMLRDGLGEPADLIQAADLIERARKADNGTALFLIGQAYEKGDGGHARDPQEAAKWYVRATNRSSAEANLRLGALALTGTLHGSPDAPLAYGYVQKAVDLGSVAAMQRLAQMSQQGQTPGHVRDFGKAFEWYSRAAAAGRADSMVGLARLYLDGLGVVADPAKAHGWLEKAAALGDSGAMLQLGSLDFEGIGAPRDPNAAIGWFEKAAAAGRTESYARLGALYQASFEAVRSDQTKPDFAQAFAWDEKGAALNDPQSFFQLGTLYEGGLGRSVDYAKAEGAYQRAGDLGFARAYFALALMAERGRGRPVDFARAVAYHRRAANLSYAPALVRLGQLTEAGSGTDKDETAALLDFTKALQLGNAQGLWYAAVMTDAGRGGPKNPDRVAGYLLDAYGQHEMHAVAALAGDLSGFSVETRIALQRQLQARGLLSDTTLDGTYDAATRDAVIASARAGTN